MHGHLDLSRRSGGEAGARAGATRPPAETGTAEVDTPHASPPEEGGGGKHPERGLIVLALLVGALLAVNLSSRRQETARTSAGESLTAPTPTGAPSLVPSLTVPAALPPAPVVAPPAGDGEVLEVVGKALEAWGRFAVSGDLAEVAGLFAAGGPQFRRFETEAAAFAAAPLGPPPYRYEMIGPTVVEIGAAERMVQGSVVVSRPDEPQQTFHWSLLLRWMPDAGRWQVWSVVPSPGS